MPKGHPKQPESLTETETHPFFFSKSRLKVCKNDPKEIKEIRIWSLSVSKVYMETQYFDNT